MRTGRAIQKNMNRVGREELLKRVGRKKDKTLEKNLG